MSTNRPLRVFLCHSSNDKPVVRELYKQLSAEPWIQPWLDEEDLYPGQDWNLEIERAVEASDAILVCLTRGSITREGYVQRELRIVLDLADYKPEGTLFIIPVRLEECEPPRRLRPWQYADYFAGHRERAFQRLLVSLRRRAEVLGLGLAFGAPSQELKEKQIRGNTLLDVRTNHIRRESVIEAPKTFSIVAPLNKIVLSNGMEFMRIPAGKFLMGSGPEDKQAYDDEKLQHMVDIPYNYWMARFPVTNELYNVFANSQRLKHPVDGWEKKKDHPVAFVSWKDAMTYCKWLSDIFQTELLSGLVLRLPTEAEWEKAARGTDGRLFPWGNQFGRNNCNTSEARKGGTTPVVLYSPQGDSTFGCADMAGNVWEWTHSLKKRYPYNFLDGREDDKAVGQRVLRGGSFNLDERSARCAYRLENAFIGFSGSFGFRVVASPRLS